MAEEKETKYLSKKVNIHGELVTLYSANGITWVSSPDQLPELMERLENARITMDGKAEEGASKPKSTMMRFLPRKKPEDGTAPAADGPVDAVDVVHALKTAVPVQIESTFKPEAPKLKQVEKKAPVSEKPAPVARVPKVVAEKRPVEKPVEKKAPAKKAPSKVAAPAKKPVAKKAPAKAPKKKK